MSTNLVGLAVLMALVTYPSRAIPLPCAGLRPAAAAGARVPPAGRAGGPGLDRRVADLPRPLGERHRARFTIRIEWLAVAACVVIVAWRRNLLLGLIVLAVRDRGRRPGLGLAA